MNIFLRKNSARKILVSLTILILFSISGFITKAIIINNGPFETNIGSTDATIIWTTDGNIESPAASDSTVYYTADNAFTWSQQTTDLASFSFTALDGIDRRNIWAAGNWDGNSKIFYFNGTDWTEQYNLPGVSLYGISVLDKDNIWATANNGNIYFYDGTNWSLQTSISYSLYDIKAYDATHVYAVGSSASGGGLYLFNGTSWNIIQTTNYLLDDLWVSDSNHIWITSDLVKDILFYDGSSLTVQYNPTFGVFDIDGVDNSHIWAVGQGGAVYFFNGSSWNYLSSTGSHLFAVSASSANELSVAGTSSFFAYSLNGGGEWHNNLPGEVFSVYSVLQFSPSQVWIGGYNPDIYFFGIDFDSFLYDSASLDTHIMTLTELSPLTTHYYYVCSENENGEEVCSNNYSFTTLAACSDGTADGACNVLHQYCEGTTLVPADGPNCLPDRCNFDCSTLPDTPYCDTTLQTCVDRCIDGTESGSCNASLQFCNPVTITLSDNCKVNETQCGYTCPDMDYPYCHTDGICYDWCSDLTPFGECSTLTNQYCDAGTLTPTDGEPNCAYNCFDCATTPSTPYCDETGTEKCIAACSDGTLLNECNLSDQYCDSSLTLINDCTRCGYNCPLTEPYCDDSGDVGVCRSWCTDGTARETCNTSLQYCDSNLNLDDSCSTKIEHCLYICPGDQPYCNTDGDCVAACPDGTLEGNCSGDYLCNTALNLVHYCGSCGYTCPANAPYCDNGNCLSDRCADGTFPNQCNLATGQYCDSLLTLIDDCNCGHICPADQPYCDTSGDIGVCRAWCEDETPGETCNLTTFEYCDSSLNLLDDCGTKIDQCGYVCPSDFPYCNRTTGECVEACSDGTLEGECSGNLYCNSDLELVNDCRQAQCGYTCSDPTPQCNEETGICEIDNTAPIISNINIDADVFSAILTFNTNESASTIIMVETNPYCSPESSTDNVATIVNFDFLTNHLIDIIDLNPSTTFYLCIYVEDAYGNVTFTGEPSEISFETLTEPDTTPPEVNIITPNEGDTVSGLGQIIEVEATDNVEVSYVEIFIDGSLETIAHLTSPSSGNIYTSVFDTTLWDNGEHTLRAIARDTAGYENESTIITFTIYNDIGPPVIENINAEISVDENDLHIATITWTTNEPATSRIDYTLENIDGSFDTTYGGDTACTNLGHCVQSSEYVTSHTIILNNLDSNRRYHYQVTSCDPEGNCSH